METDDLTADNDFVGIHSIRDLCTCLALNYATVLVPCNFCGATLTALDCVFFDQADCRLLWKDGLAFGVCHGCLKQLARFEYLAFSRGSCTASAFESMLGRSLHTVSVRCLTCLRRLQETEVEEAKNSNKVVHLVGVKVRVKCTLCELGL